MARNQKHYDTDYKVQFVNLAKEIAMLREQNKKLSRENKRLKEENEFLEEASAFFAASRRKSARTSD
ncbi:transposase [Acetitomaculum ruminis DSM 5522]|uniref:Transposase n=1 Tax=Acetitomaculum ruminis DSM 5522 TaxID=1120918 RepID=A0A1I1AH84_9FIRM|nr:hypothetical protein [Acetitomaculum ruminis]SFB36852.1 transposase [Acetitomaculum ruminis DSM 5522]